MSFREMMMENRVAVVSKKLNRDSHISVCRRLTWVAIINGNFHTISVILKVSFQKEVLVFYS